MGSILLPRSRLPDPARQFTEIPLRRVPQLEFGARLPTFRAKQETNFETGILNGASPVLTWDSWENGDTRFFSEDLTGSPAELVSVDLLQAGIYSFTCSVTINPAPAAGVGTFGIGFNDALAGGERICWQTFHGVSGNTSGSWAATFIFGVPYYLPLVDPGSPPWLSLTWEISNDTGATVDTLERTDFEIYYLGGLSVEEFVAP